jgi:hypothetical protein
MSVKKFIDSDVNKHYMTFKNGIIRLVYKHGETGSALLKPLIGAMTDLEPRRCDSIQLFFNLSLPGTAVKSVVQSTAATSLNDLQESLYRLLPVQTPCCSTPLCTRVDEHFGRWTWRGRLLDEKKGGGLG